MVKITPSDVWRIYFKPSVDNRMIARKRTVIRRSPIVRAINLLIQNLVAEHPELAPSRIAKALCLKDHPEYEGRTCPQKLMYSRYQRLAMEIVGIRGLGSFAKKAVEACWNDNPEYSGQLCPDTVLEPYVKKIAEQNREAILKKLEISLEQIEKSASKVLEEELKKLEATKAVVPKTTTGGATAVKA